MKNCILMNQLLFLKHISSLEEGLAREFHDYQQNSSIPGLVKSTYEVIEKLKIGNISDYSKNQWKKIVRKKIESIQKEELIEDMKKYKKIDHRSFQD